MQCDMCKEEVQGHQSRSLHICDSDFRLCKWCEVRLLQYADGNANGGLVNIFWGYGRFNHTDWFALRDFLRENKIKEVLEMGIGLSTELFVNEGLKVMGFDTHAQHVRLYGSLASLKNNAKFYYYKEGLEPPVEQLLPNRKWDFVLVDGPNRRAPEVRVAMRVASKFLMIHDPNLDEETFFPDENWSPILTSVFGPKLFKRKADQ